MAGIGSLFIDLAINTATFVTDINRVNQNLDSMQKKANVALAKVANGFNATRSSVNKFGAEMFSAKGIMAQLTGAAGMGLLINKSLDLTSAMVDTADSVGLTTTQLQEYQFAAAQSGVNTEKFNLALSKFIKNVGDAQQGDGALVSTLKDHNLALLENIRHAASQDEAFRLVADAIKNAKTSTEAAVIANAAFGKSGVAMVNMLRDGSAGLDEFARQAQAAGIIMDESLVRAAEEAGDKLEMLGTFAMRQVTIEVAKMAPQIVNLTENLIGMLPAVIKVADVIGNAMVMAFEGWGKIIDYLSIGMIRFQEKLGNISSQVAEEQIRLMGESARKTAEDVNKMNVALEKTSKTVQPNKSAANPNIGLPTLAGMNSQKEGKAAAEKAQQDMDKKAQTIFDQTRTPVEQYQTKLDELNGMLNEGAISWDTYNRAIMQASTGLDQHIGVMDGATNIMNSFLDGQIHSWKDLGKAGMKALDDIMGNMLKMTMTGGGNGLGGMLSSIFGNAASGGATGGMGASLGGLLGKAGSSIMGAFTGGFGGFFADGGNFSGGKPIVVGERGPELIVPRRSGTVLPMDGGEGGGMTIKQNFFISTPDVQGFRRSQGQITAEAAMALRSAARNL